jgi:glycosyltransferase involved in cell wall biosynthesis
MLNRAARIHVTTDRERVEVESLGLTAPVVVVPNGVDDFVFEAGTLARSSELEELRASKQLLLFLGRVDQKKGLDVLLPAMRFVRTPNVLLVVIGPRNEEHFREVRSRARELQIEDRIRFLDPLYGAQRFGAYSASEIFILPSKQENFGLSVAEAMACAVPVIVSPEVALADFVLQHGAGLAVPRDSEQLACSIDQLLDNPSLRREMGQNGRAAAQSAFRWSAIAARWKELYAELLVQHRHQHAR